MQGGLCQQAGRAPLVSTQGQSDKTCLAIPAHRGGCRICILGLSCCSGSTWDRDSYKGERRALESSGAPERSTHVPELCFR